MYYKRIIFLEKCIYCSYTISLLCDVLTAHNLVRVQLVFCRLIEASYMLHNHVRFMFPQIAQKNYVLLPLKNYMELNCITSFALNETYFTFGK